MDRRDLFKTLRGIYASGAKGIDLEDRLYSLLNECFVDSLNRPFDTNIDTFRRNYNDVTNFVLEYLKREQIFSTLTSQLFLVENIYFNEHEVKLLVDLESEDSLYDKIKIKSFSSILDKMIRINFSDNSGYRRKQPPKNRHTSGEEEWIEGKNFLISINDIFRRRIVVSYLDGIERVFQALRGQENTSCVYEARPESGYFAGHVYLKFDAPIDISGTIKKLILEVQITTPLREAFSHATHYSYEKTRIGDRPDSYSYFKSDSPVRKITAFGNMIQEIEASIIALRDKVEDTQ